MGIKRKRSATYVADTGKEFELGDMTTSHLMNAIAHHMKQAEALAKVTVNPLQSGFLQKHCQGLTDTICALAQELDSRDPDKEEETPRTGNRWRDSDHAY